MYEPDILATLKLCGAIEIFKFFLTFDIDVFIDFYDLK